MVLNNSLALGNRTFPSSFESSRKAGSCKRDFSKVNVDNVDDEEHGIDEFD